MTLISAAELRAALDAGTPLTVLDVRYYLPQPGRGKQEYDAGHIPGAVFVDTDTDLAAHATGPGGRHPLPTADAFGESMRAAGVSADVPVVVYDQQTSLSAGRAWWMLRNAGHPDVRVLDGGYAAWLAAGGAVSTYVPTPTPGTFAPAPDALPTIEAADIPDFLDAGHRLFDVRAAERFRGEVEPIDPVAGHIPGATNLPATSLFTENGRFKSAHELGELLAGVRPGDAVSCGSGITAAQVLVALDAAGIDGVALYPGSWSDWISDPNRPIATGE